MSRLLIVILALLSFGACPSPEQVTGMEWFAADLNCPVPIEDARVYTREAHEEIAGEILGLERLVLERDASLLGCRDLLRSERLRTAERLRGAGEELDALAAQLEDAADPPSRLAWAGMGAVAGLVATVSLWVLVAVD